MVQELISEGICSTCIHRSGCLSNKSNKQAGRPVLYCEEFDDSAARKDGKSVFIESFCQSSHARQSSWRGERVNTEHLDGILEFLSIFVDKCHHGKEEEFLFPALEIAGVPRKGGPIGVMLNEHEQGRKLVARLKETMTGYKSGVNENASSAQLIINEYVTLLTQHIAKENNVLFPMADSKLDSKKDTELFEAFEQLERERIGSGKHDEFHALLDQLQNTYLV